MVTLPDRRYKQVRSTIAIDVGERGSYGDLIDKAHARQDRDVFEPAVAEIAPELVGAQLGGEINVREPVAVDIRDGKTVAVIIVDGLVVLPGIVHDVMFKADVTFREAINEPEIVERLAIPDGPNLLRVELLKLDHCRLSRNQVGARVGHRRPGRLWHWRGCHCAASEDQD